MDIVTVLIDDLELDPNNARRHSKKNLDAIAGSLVAFGQRKPIVVWRNRVVAGNGTLVAARSLGWREIVVAKCPDGWDEVRVKAFALADNRSAELAEWDEQVLTEQLRELELAEFDVEAIGFEAVVEPEPVVEDELPEVVDTRVQLGQVWQLGRHRLMCGDSTNADAVAKLMNDEVADLVHADPPYGMGKEKDGVENDNLYREKLDAFQMDWFKTVRPHVADNAGVYIWGNPEDLWRLWFVGGLRDFERITFRNEIVWSKPGGMGIGSESHRSYPVTTERCLFLMLGEQGFNNNADNYWEGFEPIRTYLKTERDKLGWNNKVVADFFGFHPRMADHWFSQSQWAFPRKEQYERLQKEAEGDAFKREYDAFKREYDDLKREYDDLKREFYDTRSFFDNTHENMTEVWNYVRVHGEERHGHATPKPVEMMARIMRSSLPEGGLCVEPFGGSGSTLIGAEQTGRRCFTMELTPAYCDVIIARWEKLTGETAVLVEG